MRILRKLKKSEKGQGIVEFALVLPILIALLLGIVEFGWLLNGYVTLNASAREGARLYAVSHPDEDEAIEAVMGNINLSPGLSVDNIVFSTEKSTTGNRDVGIVSISVNIEPILGLYVKNNIPWTSVAKMLLE